LSAWILEKAHAKINLSLHVLGRREDGYHELDSVVGFAGVCDVLQVRASLNNSCSVSGPYAAELPDIEDNIIFKAWQQAQVLLAGHGIQLPMVDVKLEKNLPVSAGIGGGSADAAAMLRALFRLVGFEISQSELAGLAQSLGADVPVCFLQKACRMQGIGEIVSPLESELPKSIVLVNPNVPCSTAEVFKELGLAKGQRHRCGQHDWHNDLTQPALKVQPEILKVLAVLQKACGHAQMSGSGATCFASVGDAARIAEEVSEAHPHWWVWGGNLF
jgi:4-diphosphocytidyl-2-C-methyl-D-erythritol kinase